MPPASTDPQNIAVIGSSGAIGHALANEFVARYPSAHLSRVSRTEDIAIDYQDEASIARAAKACAASGPLDLVIVATGLLHGEDLQPEKSLRDLSAEKFERIFRANVTAPALIAKHFLPELSRNDRSVFAALSARVGSISDNRLGGWYAYRASKAALNMVIKTAAIEQARRRKQAIIVGLHPGTVDSPLSQPFQSNVADGKLFTPDYAAKKLAEILESLTPADSGNCYAWDGQQVLP